MLYEVITFLKTKTSQDMAIVAEAVSYLKIVALSYFFIGCSVSFAIIIRSVEIVIISLIINIISFFVNVFMNWVLIFGNLGAPKMGVRGAATATLIARIMEFSIMIFFALLIDKKLKFKIKYIFKNDKILLKDFKQYSLPVIANELAWSAGISMQALILGKLSTEILAANSIAMVLQQLSTILLFGVSQATCVIVGKQMGEGNINEAKRSGITIMIWSVVLGIIAALCVYFLRKPFAGLYNIKDETRILAVV